MCVCADRVGDSALLIIPGALKFPVLLPTGGVDDGSSESLSECVRTEDVVIIERCWSFVFGSASK